MKISINKHECIHICIYIYIYVYTNIKGQVKSNHCCITWFWPSHRVRVMSWSQVQRRGRVRLEKAKLAAEIKRSLISGPSREKHSGPD